jgi:radical SAM protein with 4Fe4S-binding SPASM domain
MHNLIVTRLRRMGGAIERYSDLAVGDKDRLWAAEQLIQRMKSRPHCNVQIEFLGLLEKAFLNSKFDANLPIYRAGCSATTSKAYIQPDGALFPCQDLAKAFGTEDRSLARGTAQWASDRYARLPPALNSLEVFQRYIPCRTCPALGTLCVPCPLRGLENRGKVSQPECLQVMERAKSEGVDLRKGLRNAIALSWRSRILQDPGFRRRFFTEALGDSVNGTTTTDEMRSFRSRVVDHLQATLSSIVEARTGR